MSTVRFLSGAQVGEILDGVELRPVLEAAMVAFSAGRSDVPPRVAATAPRGWLGAMPGHVDGMGLAAKLVTVFPDNGDRPSHQGLVAVFDAGHGTPLAVMDAEVITVARTAMTAAIAADLLARPDASVLTIVGGGAQAAAHARMFAPLRAWTEVRVVNRSQPAAVVVAGEAREAGAARAVAVAAMDADAAIGDADVVALCTHADRAVIDADVIRAGTHVSSIGSGAELPPELATGADLVVVEWRDAVCTAPPAGAAELQGLDPDTVVELGELLASPELGRTSAETRTVYKSTGHAVQDVATAQLVLAAALETGIGTEIDW